MVTVTATGMSAEGAYLLTDASLEVGQTVRLVLQSPSDPEQPSIMFKAVGEVVRTEELPGQKVGIAVKFNEIPTFSEK